MTEIIQLRFFLDEDQRMEPGTRVTDGQIDLDLGACTVPAKVLREHVEEDGRSVTLDLEIPAGAVLPPSFSSNMASFYSLKDEQNGE